MNAPRDGLLRIVLAHRWRVLATVVLLLATMLAGVGLLAVSGGFLTAAALAVGGIAGGFNLFMPSAGIRGLTAARIVSRYGEKLVGHDATLRIARDLRLWFVRRALPLAPARLGALRTGDLVARLVSDIEAVDGLLVRALGPLVALMAMGVAAIGVAALLHPPAGGLLAALAFVVGVAVPLVVALGRQRQEHRRAGIRGRLRTLAYEGLEGAGDLAALDAGGLWAARVQAEAGALADADARRRRRLTAGQALHALAVAAGLVGMLWVVAGAAHAGTLAPATAAALFFLTVAVLEIWAGVGAAWQALQAGLASLQRVRAIAGQPVPVQDPDVPQALPAGPQPLRVENLRFAWPGAERPALDGVDLELRPGERIALCGDSGSGKSTLSALLLRLWDPAAGRVSYGGVDLRDVAQADWHARIAWLPQNAPVFAGSVRENLALGDPAADAEAMWAVLRRVRLDATVEAIGGLDAWVGENGATLSGGQGRRLALARALLKPAELMVLDEPTEGLDHPTADALLRDLAQALDGRSLVLITHGRLPPGLVQRVHRVEEGRLAAAPAPGEDALPDGT
ncbi:thiol reductant ABC exporter subunit CydC [Coralloluteibacterium thermophilus]|uniref:Thiol reductant ABC exporter subunit CydC n=1 Tax=Coralloluteibacterium thermophilum TaxID=2707049 RepID=A0ABV9NKP3_9GAMM